MAYFPNGTAGEILDNQCCDCIIPNNAPCPILLAHLQLNYDQVGNKKLEECLSILVDDNGKCKMKPILDNLSKRSMKYINLTKEQVKNFWFEEEGGQ